MIYFQVKTPLGFFVSTTRAYWNRIITLKHPSMRGSEDNVQKTLSYPDEIRRSRQDKNVLLFYKRYGSIFICVVIRWHNNRGFIITTYKTTKIKEGESIWQK
ncbi:MAG: hypothetical protein A2W23_02190 [Planctomycetes bacterium RBG_16_43_13]|nr:MAG: hypothetical protein A2W23_02190 [Planctomycetes bacterium RBG_16_43_13]